MASDPPPSDDGTTGEPPRPRRDAGADAAGSLAGLEPDIELDEYERSDPLELSAPARRVLETEVNDDVTRVGVEYEPDGRARLRATRHVGILALPEGPTVEIRPKVPGTNLVGLLRYARGISPETVDEEVAVTPGQSFTEALAALFETELRTVLQRGLHTSYERTRGTETHVRGRIDVQAQLRQSRGLPTTLECEYDELTVDTTVNRAVLYATTLLQRVVRDETLAGRLGRHANRLRRRVTLTPVRPATLETVELDRLSSHYSDLLPLVDLVLRNVHVERLQAGTRRSVALLVDMAAVFEEAVERAVTDALSETTSYTVEAQPQARTLDGQGVRPITVRPDVLMRDRDGSPTLVADAKWKRDQRRAREPSAGDVQQLLTYQLVYEVPGVVFYPEQAADIDGRYQVRELDDLTLSVLPVGGPARTLPGRLVDAVQNALDEVPIINPSDSD